MEVFVNKRGEFVVAEVVQSREGIGDSVVLAGDVKRMDGERRQYTFLGQLDRDFILFLVTFVGWH